MESFTRRLKNGLNLVIRVAQAEDARALLDYIEIVSGESNFLTFGPGEFDLTEAQEAEHLCGSLAAQNQVYFLGILNGEIISGLNFNGGRRPRTRHSGEFGLTVRKDYWGLSVGGLMLDALIAWAKAGQLIKKINLRVNSDNLRAIKLYESRGFVKEGVISREIYLSGCFYSANCMGLEL